MRSTKPLPSTVFPPGDGTGPGPAVDDRHGSIHTRPLTFADCGVKGRTRGCRFHRHTGLRHLRGCRHRYRPLEEQGRRDPGRTRRPGLLPRRARPDLVAGRFQSDRRQYLNRAVRRYERQGRRLARDGHRQLRVDGRHHPGDRRFPLRPDLSAQRHLHDSRVPRVPLQPLCADGHGRYQP